MDCRTFDGSIDEKSEKSKHGGQVAGIYPTFLGFVTLSPSLSAVSSLVSSEDRHDAPLKPPLLLDLSLVYTMETSALVRPQ